VEALDSTADVLFIVGTTSAPAPRSNRLRKLWGSLGVAFEERKGGDWNMPDLVFSAHMFAESKEQ